jgi:hypothetical protein
MEKPLSGDQGANVDISLCGLWGAAASPGPALLSCLSLFYHTSGVGEKGGNLGYL